MPPATQEASGSSSQTRSDSLALIFQGIFTAIVRIQSGKQPLGDIDVFRRRMKSALQEAERDAIVARYSSDDVTNAQFAVVALLDEAILSSKDPGRDGWRKQTLCVDLFGEANAGDVFFDRLQGLVRREETQKLGDVLEVYLLCLLLGFEGRFGGAMRGESLVLAERVRRRIEGIRGLDYRLSPPLDLSTPEPALPVNQSVKPQRDWLYWILGLAGGTLLFFAVYSFHLTSVLSDLEGIVAR